MSLPFSDWPSVVRAGNREGLFFCWGVTDGLAERCVFSDNRDYGITIGHRDTDNLIKDCVIERNAKVGLIEFNLSERMPFIMLSRFNVLMMLSCDFNRVCIGVIGCCRAKVGILCGRSDASYEFFAPHRCTIQGCTLRDNGAELTHAGIQVLHHTHDTTVRGCVFESTEGVDAQQIGIEVGPEPQRTLLEANVFQNMDTDVRHIAAAL